MRSTWFTVGAGFLFLSGVAGLVPARFAAQSQNPIDAAKEIWKKARKKQEQVKNGIPGQPAGATQPGNGTAAPGGAPPGNSSGVVAGSAKVEQTVLASIHQGDQYAVSPSGIHTATLSHSGSRQVIIYDGVEGPKFDQLIAQGGGLAGISSVFFSPDGSRYAYCAQVGEHLVVLLDGKEVGQSSESNHGQFDCKPFFSPNSKHFYYASDVNKGDNRPGSTFMRFVIDGKTELRIAQVNVEGEIAFSPDGEHFAVVVTDPFHEGPNREPITSLIVDGKPAGYAGGEAQWSADSRHLYTKVDVRGPQGSLQQLQLDGKPLMRANEIRLAIPPVGDMTVVIVGVNTPGSGNLVGSRFLVVGGKKVPGSEIVSPAGQGSSGIKSVAFSGDGKHYAAVYHSNSAKEFVFADGKKGLEYQSVSGLHTTNVAVDYKKKPAVVLEPVGFTADSSKVVYVGNNGNRSFLVVGEQESEAPDTLLDTVIAPVGSHVAAIGRTVTLDGAVVPFRGVNPATCNVVKELHFSPDASHFAFALSCGGTSTLYLDGVPQSAFTIASGEYPTFAFSPDSKHLAYFCRSTNPTAGNDQSLCVDGKYVRLGGQGYLTNLTFTSDSSHVLFLSSENGADFRVYADSKPIFGPVFKMQRGIGPLPSAMWQMLPDSTLLLLADAENAMKRFTITLSPDSTVATLPGAGPIKHK